MDTIAQARLVVEMKLAVDAGDTSRIDRLIAENPRSYQAKHVMRNIGVRRAEVVRARARATPLFSSAEAE